MHPLGRVTHEPSLPPAPQLSNGKSQYSPPSQSSLLAHAAPPPVVVAFVLASPLLVSAGALDDDSLEPGAIVLLEPSVVVVSLDSVPPHASSRHTLERRPKRSMARVDHHARRAARDRRMLLLMPSPWRVAMLLPLLALPTIPAANGCFAERCTDFVDEEASADEVVITLKNATSGPIFIPAGHGCDWQPFVIEKDGDARKWSRGSCDWSCEDVLDSCECAADCAAASAIRIDAGASYELTWDLALYVTEDLSLDCPAEGCPTRCSRRTIAGEGDYDISATASTMCTDEASCACASGTTACEIFVDITATTLTAEATLALPGDAVELVFRP
jgi:hypothetical protein